MGSWRLVRKNRSGGMATNQEHFGAGVAGWRQVVPEELQDLLYDPQTSGGLLVAVESLQADLAVEALIAAGVAAARIGSAAPASDKHVVIR